MRRKNAVAYVLALILLAGAAADVSEVVCVSPEGHDAVEAWSAFGCRPGLPGKPQPAQASEPASCDGCRDYSLLPEAEFDSRKVISEKAAPAVTPVQPPTQARGEYADIPSPFKTLTCRLLPDDPPVSLRC